jgi:hypothetical protein
MLAGHSTRSTIALPLLARPYVRRHNLSPFEREDRPVFGTKVEPAFERLRRASDWLKTWPDRCRRSPTGPAPSCCS